MSQNTLVLDNRARKREIRLHQQWKKNIFESLDVQGVEEQWHKWSMKQGNGADRTAALGGRHTLNEDLSTNGSETSKAKSN